VTGSLRTNPAPMQGVPPNLSHQAHPGIPNAHPPPPPVSARPGYPSPPAQQQPMLPRPAVPVRPAPVGSPPSSHQGSINPSVTNPAASSNPSRVDPERMPRPSQVEKACGEPCEYYYRSETTSQPPFANSDYIGFDCGSATPRFMRLTTNAIAREGSLHAKSSIPLGLVLCPFANPAAGESQVPTVDLTTASGGGPLRCSRCKAYANPGFRFLSGGSSFICNICGQTNDTPTEHFAALNPGTGTRVDVDSRPEFIFGSVDFLVGSPDYCLRPPAPPSYLFVVDVSSSALSSGLTGTALSALKIIMEKDQVPGCHNGATVGIITFDQALHFYDCRSPTGAVTIQVVPDLDEPFLPLGGDGFFTSPKAAVAVLEAIESNYGLGENTAQITPSAKCALGAALLASRECLRDRGGKVFVVCGSLPSAGPGTIQRRAGATAGGEDKERLLLKESDSFYGNIGTEMAELNISTDIFLGPNSSYIDAATIMRTARCCGGRVNYIPNFDPTRDSVSLQRCMIQAVRSVVAFEAVARVRVSQGLETGEYLGHFARPQRGDDIAGPIFDSDQSIVVELSHEGKMLGDGEGNVKGGFANDVAAQCAVLYTDVMGRRRIRVHTVFASKTSTLQDVFRSADVDAVLTMMAKRGAQACLTSEMPLVKIRDALMSKCIQALFTYRKYCTNSSSTGQLILPEALKLLPIYILGLLKSPGFRVQPPQPTSPEAVPSDERAFCLMSLSTATPAVVVALAYPRMYSLESIPEAAGIPLPKNEGPMSQNPDLSNHDSMPICLPPTIPLTSEKLEKSRVLLIDGGTRLVAWVGEEVDQQMLQDAFVVPGAGDTNMYLLRGEILPGSGADMPDRAQRIIAIIQRLLNTRPGLCQTRVVMQRDPDGADARHFLSSLVEDRSGADGLSYVDFLRHVHRQIMNKIEDESSARDISNWEMLSQGY